MFVEWMSLCSWSLKLFQNSGLFQIDAEIIYLIIWYFSWSILLNTFKKSWFYFVSNYYFQYLVLLYFFSLNVCPFDHIIGEIGLFGFSGYLHTIFIVSWKQLVITEGQALCQGVCALYTESSYFQWKQKPREVKQGKVIKLSRDRARVHTPAAWLENYDSCSFHRSVLPLDKKDNLFPAAVQWVFAGHPWHVAYLWKCVTCYLPGL